MDVNEYLNLVPTENFNKPKFMAYLEAVLNNAVGLGVLTESIGSSFDIANAAGQQLDIIGEMVGVGRVLSFIPFIGTREMTDDEYRVIILMKILRNEWDGTMEGAVEIYKNAFGDDVRVEFYDDGDCHVSVSLYVWSTRLAQILNSTGVLLIPAGIGKTVNVVNEIHMDVGVYTEIVCTMSKQTVLAVDSNSFDVGDIQDLFVSDLEWRYVRRIQS